MASLHIANEFRNLIFLITHPVGSYYISENGTSPAQTYGGSWTKITGYYLYADSSVSTTNYTGKGTQGHKLTASQSGLRGHGHSFNSGTGNTFETLFVTNAGGWSFPGSSSGYGFKGGYAGIGDTGGWDAESEHSHNIATKGVIVYKRIG